MTAKFTKFSIVFIFLFGLFAGCSQSKAVETSKLVAEPEKIIDKSVNDNVNGTSPDVQIPDSFQSIAFKKVNYSETMASARQKREFHGASQLRDLFGAERVVFDTTYVYLSDDKPIVVQSKATWYVNHRKNGSLEYKLSYRKNIATDKIKENDLLFIGKVNESEIYMVISDGESAAKDWFVTSLKTQSSAKIENEKGEIITPVSIEPTESWYKVFFTPGPDCENNIIARMNKAKKIEAAVYIINNGNIVDALLAAHKRGAKIRIVTSSITAGKWESRVPDLERAGISVRRSKVVKVEHNKWAVFDDKDVKMGSFNWTDSATKSNSESCMFFQQQKQKEFTTRFQQLWDMYNRD